MPSELLSRVQRLLNPRVARDVNTYAGTSLNADVPAHPPGAMTNPATPPTLNTVAHWAKGIGGVLQNASTITIHGTSGWVSHQSAVNSGSQVKSLCDEWRWSPGLKRWVDGRGVASQFTIDSNGTIFPIIGPENADGDLLMLYHNEAMNPCSIGVENCDFGDSKAIILPKTTSKYLYRLNESASVTPTTEDLAGMQLYAQLHPGGDEDVALIWIALPTYRGPGDIVTTTNPPQVPNRQFGNWKNSLFTERDYISLVTLCRFLAESNSIPRNFPSLPYAVRASDSGNADVFRSLLLGDPTCDQIADRLGIDVTVLRAGGTTWANAYLHDSHRTALQFWKGFFGLPTNAAGAATMPSYRGFLSHCMNGGHLCPGPLFDWHRFAREMWDWWWYPFDFETGTLAQPATTTRAYRQARRDTRLVEYYFDAAGTVADYEARRITVTPPLSVNKFEQFDLEIQVPVYALANGVAVAARLPRSSSGTPGAGFLLTRHEVFTPEASGRIRYDTPPIPVWSLVRCHAAPGYRIDQIGLMNPDWLNRLVIRLTECELAVKYHQAHTTNDHLTRGWRHQPIPPAPGAPTNSVPTVGEKIERDAIAYRRLADDLFAEKVVMFPRVVEGAATPVRVILGDFLGTPGERQQGVMGIQVEIFSKAPLPIPGRLFQGVSARNESWWASVSAAARHEASDAADLPADGFVWVYPMIDFLQWINTITWHHEWSKYFVLDFSRSPPVDAPAPPRPNSRTSF